LRFDGVASQNMTAYVLCQLHRDQVAQTSVFGLMTSFTQRSQDILYTRLGR
jgi:hypothetical protein